MYSIVLQVAGDTLNWPEATVAIGGIAMITVIVAVAIWQVLASWRARVTVAREEAYRRLAGESASTQARLAEQQADVTQSLQSINERLTGIERVLRDVG